LLVTVNANSIKTNINGVVIKKPSCSSGSLFVTISNRSANSINAKLFVTSFDADKDPIGNGSRKIALGPVSGNRYAVTINCLRATSYAYRFEQTN